MRKPVPQGKNVLLSLIKEKEPEVIPGKLFIPQSNNAPKSRLYTVLAVGEACENPPPITAVVCIGNNYPSNLDLDGETYYVCKESEIVAIIL